MSTILHIPIDPASGVPIYRQIMEQFRNYISSGVLQPGDQLPSIRDLARRLHINATTITKAYTELHHAGVVQLHQGKGVFVAEGAPGRTRVRREEELRRLAASLGAAALRMGVPFEEASEILDEEMQRLGRAPAGGAQGETRS